MICFFHRADLDGQCSGAIIKDSYPRCRMIGVDYGDNIDELLSKADSNEEVFVVDFCFEPFSRMEALNEKCKLTWIDHHKSAISAYEESDSQISGIRDVGVSAAELTWGFLSPKSVMPLSVYYIGRYDVWDWETRSEPIKEFQLGLQIHDTSPGAKIWDEILVSPRSDIDINYSNVVDRICNDGEAIMLYLNKVNFNIMEEGSFDTTLYGYKVLAINTPSRGSELLKSKWDKDKYDIMMVFTYLGDRWRYSLYSEGDVDVSEIAQKFGGGGHQKAAGFITEKCIIL